MLLASCPSLQPQPPSPRSSTACACPSHRRHTSLTLFIQPKSLTNFFNTLPRESTLRLPVYNALLDLASTNDELQVLQVSRADVEKWIKEWDIAPSDKSAFLERFVDVFSKAGQPYAPPHLSSLSAPEPRSVQRHGLPLQACARPLARSRIAGNTADRTRRDRHGTVQPVHLGL